MLVRIRGLEPPQDCSYQNLNLARLPIPPYPHVSKSSQISSQLSGSNSETCNIMDHSIMPTLEPESSSKLEQTLQEAENAHDSGGGGDSRPPSGPANVTKAAQTCEIPLTRGYVALVSPEDYERVSAFKWCATVHKRKGGTPCVYAQRAVQISGKSVTVLLHRFIMGCSGPIQIDHRDGNGLNNRRFNLRPATIGQNGFNRRKSTGKTSRFKGVRKGAGKAEGKWIASIEKDHVRVHTRECRDEVDAATLYNFWALELFGEFAVFNTPDMPDIAHGRTRKAAV